nr:phosphatidylinositol phosphate 5 kinase type III [Hymenolepis microstoma]
MMQSLTNQKSGYLETVMVGTEKCSTGQHIIDWLVSNSGEKIDSREKAFALCEAYLKASFLRPLDNRKSPWKFIDGPELYRICEDMDDSPHLPKPTKFIDNPIRRNSLFFESISLSHIGEELSQRDTGRSLSTFALNRPLLENLEIKSPQQKEPMVASNFTTLNPITVYTDYLEKLIQQETRDNCLWGDWKSLIGEAVRLLCDVLHLDLRKNLAKNLQRLREQQEESPRQHCFLIENKELQEFFRSKYSPMNILRYVHVKKALDNSESVQVLNGIAFTGHLINKHLPTQFFRPRILLLASSITYERNIYRRTYLGSYAAQEEEYLGNCVTKILSLRPTVILVEGGIANIAMSMLVKSGIAIFCNVKRAIMIRVAASTGAAIVNSIDALLSGNFDDSCAGTCRWYKLLRMPQLRGNSKPLCIFCFNDPPVSDKVSSVNWLHIPGLCPVSEQESLSDSTAIRMPAFSVILRGPELATLKLVKRCFKLAILACFNGGFEMAFLEDAKLVIMNDPLNMKSPPKNAKKLAQHLAGRLINLSPLVDTKIPYLSSPEAEGSPLFEYYCYLVEWGFRQRLNDILRQKVVVTERKLYPLRKGLVDGSFNPGGAAKENEGTGQKKPRFLRRWTAQGRIIAAQNAAKSNSPRSPPSRTRVKTHSKRLARSVRDARSHLLTYILRSVFSFSPAAPPQNCIMPWIIGIDLYSDNDLPLGAFLEHYCFRNLNCPNSSCRISMLEHVQRFTQASGTLELTIQTIEQIEVPNDIAPPIGTPSLALHSIMVGWYCPSCKQASQYHPISQYTWHLSFVKFVDLFINSSSCFAHERIINRGPICPIKNLHIYFAAGTRRVTFRYKPTMVFDVSMPPLSVWSFFPLYDPVMAQSYSNSIIERHANKASKKSGAVSVEPVEMPDFLLKDVKETLKKYYEVVLRVKSHLVTLRDETRSEDSICLLDAFDQSLSLECAETGIKSRVEILAFLFDNLSTSQSLLPGSKSTVNEPDDTYPLERSLGEEIDSDRTLSLYESLAPWMIPMATLSFEEKISLMYALLYLIRRWVFKFVNDWNTRLSRYNLTAKLIEKSIYKERKVKTTPTPTDPPIDQTPGSFQELSPSPSIADLIIDDTDTSGKNITVGAVKRIITAILPGSSETKLNLDSWPIVEHPQILPPNDESPLLRAIKIEPVSSPRVGNVDNTPIVCAKEKLTKKLSEIRILEVMPDVYVIDQEITSIVAYALATDVYAFKLQKLSELQANTNKKSYIKSSELQISEIETKSSSVHSSSVSRKSGMGAISLGNAVDDAEPASSVPDDTKSLKASSIDPHIEIQFADASTNFSCRIYYAEEFHQLRKIIFPQGEAGFIRSLSRCHNWAAKGGKSGSLFMKTHDERFIVKELSSIELKTFHDIKDQYFNYLTTARLSLLARILGIFNVEFKNTASGENRRLDVLVMENLFHNRPGISQIYDLKGCFRGRLVDTSADPGCISSSSVPFPPPTASNIPTDDLLAHGLSSSNVPVLLDLNFLNDTIVNPIYVRLHSKNALMHCLQLDTQFLADLFIMDYSLLVGVDRVTGQLVMGIIDYLRKFTFNKRVEMIVKQAISSVQGPMPTIIMPVDYRDRLIEQMDRNFHLVPDQWSKMSGDEVVPRTKGNLTVALICDCFYPNIGGVESHIYQLAQCLLSRGHRVIVITHSYGVKWQRQGVRYMAKGLKVYYIPYRPFYCQAIFITVFGELSVVRDIFIRESVDIVHGHSAFSPLALESLIHAKAMGLSALFTDHSLFGFADLSSILANRALHMFLNVVDNFICVSNVAKENTVLRGHMEPERVYVIPNAIDSTAFTPDPSCRDPDNITVVIISRLVYRKGADLMALIIPPMCHTFPNLRFIIGGDGPMRLALEEMRERHNLHFRVEMLGALPHHKVRDVLVRGDIFLNVSLTESFCIAIVEAASCGLLVVSTKVGGVPEVLPQHMMRLAPASASELASTLANAVEEIRQQRLQWSHETSLTRSVSQEALHNPEHLSQRAASQYEMSEVIKIKRETVENSTGLRTGYPRIQRTLPPSWPPASAVEIAWQRHREIRQFYTWHDVARRTEIAYHAAMSRPRITPLEAAKAAYQKLGPVCGKIMAIAWIIDWILLIILEWIRPANTIDRVPYFTTTPLQFEMWNKMETSPYVETTTPSSGGNISPKKYTLKGGTATSTRDNSTGRMGAISLGNAVDDAEPASSVPDDTKSLKASSIDPHIEIQFADASTNFSCRIYYAEEFHQLRKIIFPQGEAGFIRSLSRCHNWAAKGGKSGSLFMKTHDERFIVKELSSIELKTFHDIKDQYFNYLTTARLSLLARILGIFNVEFKNTASGENRRLDVLVMENLFHNRPGISQIYDLKGCFRGRLVDTSADPGCISSSSVPFPPPTASNIPTDDLLAHGLSSSNVPVLLDLNFLNDTIVNPIYVRLHSKNALMHCLQLDTQFLADLFIMDYSLLVGVDRVTGQLVMGIIDYLRKFTFNKRVEMIVKQAISSVQGPMPTIIMPVDYRDRLIEQMDRNFHLVPDQWSKMSGDEVVPRTKGNLTVALICDCFYPNIGGVESHIYQLAQCLLSRGHRVIVITHSYGVKWQRQGVRYMAKGLKVYYIPYRPFYCQAIFITVFGELSVVRDIFIRESVDIVHGHSAFSPLALESLIHAKAMGLSALFTDHSLFGFADLSSILANRALHMFLNVVDNFICVSNVAKENTVLRGHMEPERVYVIPNAIDSTAFTPDPSCRDPDNITVVIISRLVYRKGADLMALIIPPMCHTFPNLRFIIGGDGPMRLALEEMRERHNLHFRVEMLGALPHHKVRDVLVRGDIFLNVSLTESFCIAIVEAASCGLLVVSTKVGGVPEVLPQHMMRLAPASASELASTLANAVEEIRQQRLQWSHETSLTRSVSQEALHNPEHLSQRAASQYEMSEVIKIKRETVENSTGLRTGYPRIQRTLPPSWPPASAVEIAWQRHREIRQFYTWHDVARRTEIAYHAAMSRPRITPLEAAKAAYQKLGPVCGKIMAIAWIIDWILLIILEWIRPANTIDRVPYFTTTPLQFEMWNKMETSPYVETTTPSSGGNISPKKYTLKGGTATSTRDNSTGRNVNRSPHSS